MLTFFRDPKGMVHGEVRPPLLDLANRDLVESHLSAVWLACTEEPLEPSIAELLVLADPARPLKPEVKTPMLAVRASEEAVRRIRRVLDLLEDDLNEELAPWYPGRDEFAVDVVGKAVDRFDKAFNRWRDLFLAAEQQRDAAHRTESDYSAPPAEKKAAKSRYLQARDQLELLQKGTSSQSSDFYTYRYLATEGFLPGYNFPRLPLMAYVPATNDGRGRQTYLQRPRFLALSEFGPRSLVYHEGRAYRVVRALLSLSHQDAATPDTKLPTKSVRICKSCGAGHFNDQASLCHACGASLGDAEIVNHVYRIENVATQPAERISANDEERQRQGYELQTTFEWAVRDHVVDVRRGAAADTDGEIVRLAYGPAATITRLNKGLRRRAVPTRRPPLVVPGRDRGLGMRGRGGSKRVVSRRAWVGSGREGLAVTRRDERGAVGQGGRHDRKRTQGTEETNRECANESTRSAAIRAGAEARGVEICGGISGEGGKRGRGGGRAGVEGRDVADLAEERGEARKRCASGASGGREAE